MPLNHVPQTYEFITGRTLFHAQGGPTWSEEDDLLANQLELLSVNHQFPAYFYQNSKYATRLLAKNGQYFPLIPLVKSDFSVQAHSRTYLIE
jgi:hypothetical protein